MDNLSSTLVVRMVYDGPPRAGKTTSLRSLAGSLAQPHRASEEAEGRTLFFDWLEYTGGNFEGRPIRCQILSVPGQQELAHRREMLLTSADAVIFVADSTESAMPETLESLRSLRSFLAGRPEPRPGLVVQANKRDQPDALPLAEYRDRLDVAGMAFIESVATEGVGVREAFVLAVRVALDRVRERLSSGTPTVDLIHAETPEELLARLKAAEAGSAPGSPPPAAVLLRSVLAEADAPRTPPSTPLPEIAAGLPLLPASDVPSGWVWPPVTGRLLLHEAGAQSTELRQGPDGAWRAQVNGWFFHSAPEHHFHDLAAGRQELLRWARLCKGAVERSTSRRCIVLADTGQGSWRLWQLVHYEPSLRHQLWTALTEADPTAAGDMLLTCAADLLRAREILGQEPPLPCRLELICRASPSPLYAGILPPPSWAPSAEESGGDAAQLLARELLPLLQKALLAARLDIPRVLESLQGAGAREGFPHLQETLSAMLMEKVQQS
jgi:signal recognition particle receptor subunit beta